jgi:hypothetical protein
MKASSIIVFRSDEGSLPAWVLFLTTTASLISVTIIGLVILVLGGPSLRLVTNLTIPGVQFITTTIALECLNGLVVSRVVESWAAMDVVGRKPAKGLGHLLQVIIEVVSPRANVLQGVTSGSSLAARTGASLSLSSFEGRHSVDKARHIFEYVGGDIEFRFKISGGSSPEAS